MFGFSAAISTYVYPTSSTKKEETKKTEDASVVDTSVADASVEVFDCPVDASIEIAAAEQGVADTSVVVTTKRGRKASK